MDTHALKRLGHHIINRRVALGYRNRTDLAHTLPLTVRTLSDIELGVRKASPGTYAMLENKLNWTPGSINTILAGGNNPTPRQPDTLTDPLTHATTEDLLTELRRRITGPRHLHPQHNPQHR